MNIKKRKLLTFLKQMKWILKETQYTLKVWLYFFLNVFV